MEATPVAITAFCAALTEVTNAAFVRRGDTVNTVRFEPSKPGRSYVRIIRKDYVHGNHVTHAKSAHCFVKLDDGTLWKPDSWKGPAKNFPRGSVFDLPATEYVGRQQPLNEETER